MAILKFGSKGSAVKTLQKKLGVVADGNFGRITEHALKVWQGRHGLVADGVFGPKTYAKMYPVRSAVKAAATTVVLRVTKSALTAKGKAYLAYLNAAANNPDHVHEYYWGATGSDVDHDGSPDWDCSGIRHGALVAAGISDARTTAEGYRKRATKIVTPNEIGDFAVLLRPDGTAHHIIQYVGNFRTIEAKGKAYGVTRDTTAGVNARGAVWYRQNNVNALLNRAVASLQPL